MDGELKEGADFTQASGPNNFSSSGTMFAGSHHFTVVGGSFKNVTNTFIATPTGTKNVIVLEDIDLQEEIRSDDLSWVVDCRHAPQRTRRLYSAKILLDRRPRRMTVGIYPRPSADEEWSADLLRYSWLRHPNFVQLYGTAQSHEMNAAVFHDDLISLREFLAIYRSSPVLTVYIYAYCSTELKVT
ncbi:hypothetical protein C8F04DRAFT_132474 [Mycena alexandri]|uniref:Protein kinase domain-containing protein n=1 Tax=Mycena alexandri TaxID=1745969 RepID=A0AAD6SD42_9AGAR|nr:hypothetical protein C8F04DRAFT_132474 [Mycena alexandri]